MIIIRAGHVIEDFPVGKMMTFYPQGPSSENED